MLAKAEGIHLLKETQSRFFRQKTHVVTEIKTVWYFCEERQIGQPVEQTHMYLDI